VTPLDRRAGCDRRHWDGTERRQSMSLEAPGGFKASLSGGGFLVGLLLGLLVGGGGVAYLWLRALGGLVK
jgi:hypothetical protein